MHMHQAKASTDDERAPEQRLHLLGCGVGREIEILGLDPEQQIAHRATDDEGTEAFLLQAPRDVTSSVRKLVAPHDVLVAGVDAWFARRSSRHQTGEQAANHRWS